MFLSRRKQNFEKMLMCVISTILFKFLMAIFWVWLNMEDR